MNDQDILHIVREHPTLYTAVAHAHAKRKLGPAMLAPNDVFRWMGTYGTRATECVVLLECDTGLRVVRDHIVAEGSAAHVPVDMTAFARTLLTGIHKDFILVHNHPAGFEATPSGQDNSFTATAMKLAHMLNVKIHDHVIVTSSGYYSYRHQQPRHWETDHV